MIELALFFPLFLQFITLELHVQVSILCMPPSVQVLAFLGYIPRGELLGHRHYLIGVAKLSSAEAVPV